MNALPRSRRLQSGVSMVEALMTSMLTTLVLVIALNVFASAMGSAASGAARMDSESTAQAGVRMVAGELREAMWVSVDADGLGLSFRKPARDVDGNYQMPVAWDGVARRIQLAGNRLRVVEAGVGRDVVRNVVTTDYMNGGTAYRIFTAGGTGTVRSINVMLITHNGGDRNVQMPGRYRESIYLRNIPELLR